MLRMMQKTRKKFLDFSDKETKNKEKKNSEVFVFGGDGYRSRYLSQTRNDINLMLSERATICATPPMNQTNLKTRTKDENSGSKNFPL